MDDSSVLNANIANEDYKYGTVSKLYVTPSVSCRKGTEKDVRITHAADAPRTSCLLAFVKKDSIAENSRVATSKIPMQIALLVFAFIFSNMELT